MTMLFAVLLAITALAVCAIRPDTATATTPRRAWASMQAAGWKCTAWAGVKILAGVAAVLAVAALRTGLYGATLAVAAMACWVATKVSLDRRPVRVHRLEIAR